MWLDYFLLYSGRSLFIHSNIKGKGGLAGHMRLLQHVQEEIPYNGLYLRGPNFCEFCEES